MNAPAFYLLAGLLMLAGLAAAWRLIGTLDEDSPPWRPGPLLCRLLPDRLAAQYATPDPVLSDLLRTDLIIAAADAILLVDRTLTGAGL